MLLTDSLRCPRCGPEFGLVLLAERIDAERRVLEGSLGCPNCRNRYPIREGVADLRLGAPSEQAALPEATPDPDAALRLAALLGLAEGGGRVVLRSAPPELAKEVAALAPRVQVAAVLDAPVPSVAAGRVDEVLAEGMLPFASGSLRGVAFPAAATAAHADDALRALGPKGRLVLEGVSPEVAGHLRGAGVRILLEEDGVLVAEAEHASAVAPLEPRG